ncbi:MAG: FeoB-associated Cys-rich membrane protein [Clostridiaceae bacterium]|nr:FeoB-associated Cys-rich membrane protein [Clostridiaceae bacterium]
MANIIIGIVFFGIVAFAAYKTIKSMRSNSCPGCACGCSDEQRRSCGC